VAAAWILTLLDVQC